MEIINNMKRIIICIPIVILSSCGFNCKDYVNDIVKPKTIKAIVEKKEEIAPGLGRLYLKSLLNNELDSMNYCFSSPFRQHWDEISVGDTILKNKGSEIVYLHTQKVIIKWDRFPCCDW